MFRVRREGEHWRATGSQTGARGSSPLDALRAVKQRETSVMQRPRRWVVYAASDDAALSGFAEAVSRAGRHWKPLAVQPHKLDETIKAVQPEAVVVRVSEPRDEALLRRTWALHGQRRVVVDDRHLPVVSKLLRSAQHASPPAR